MNTNATPTDSAKLQSLLTRLREAVRGEVHVDPLSIGLYATDASMYQMAPLAVVVPLDREDALTALRLCGEAGVAILPRGGGTSLSGQTVNRAVVIDMSKRLNRLLEVNAGERWARVEPGLVRDELNDQLRPHRLHFAPDPATSSRANIGGMIGNNAAGMRSIKYGMTIDHILSIDLALPTGEVLTLGEIDEAGYAARCHQQDREGEIYRGFRQIIETHREEIRARYPKVLRRSGGYPLDAFAGPFPWNMARLVVSSEGTFGLILEVKVNLEPVPAVTGLCVAHFTEMGDCLRSVGPIVAHGPSAVELVDGLIIRLARENLLTRETIARHIVGEPAAILCIEAQDENAAAVQGRLDAIAADLRARGAAYALPITLVPPEVAAINHMRSSALGLMTTVKGERKPTAYIEDASVPLEHLPEYALGVLEILRRHERPVSLFAHASVGLLHIRPLHNLHKPEEIAELKAIQDECFALCVKYGGSFSGEHGDGIVRGRYIEPFFGPRLYEAFRQIRRLFDPREQMNPGKIIDPYPVDANLRYGAGYQMRPFDALYHYRDDGGGFQQAVEQCTGVGECRKTLGGTMCPSYIATRDEAHSTRGRGNVLRLAMTGQLGAQGLASDEVLAALDLCLSCKGCKKECPNNVDMARLKAEALNQARRARGSKLRDRIFAGSADSAAWLAGPLAPVVNFVNRLGLVRWGLDRFLGIDARRPLPAYAAQTLSAWRRSQFAAHRPAPAAARPRVVLFDDTTMECYEPAVGRAAIEVLEAAGFDVELARVGDSQRPAISKGALDQAKARGVAVLRRLEPFARAGLPILVCEPSCFSALADDLPDLCDDEDLARVVSAQVKMIDTFLGGELAAGRCRLPWVEPAGPVEILFHGHCHQKALEGVSGTRSLLTAIPGATVRDTQAGCCGMAGSFGYEKEHYDLSVKVAEDRLLPVLRAAAPRTIIVANGFSCRHQIADLAGREAGHAIEIVRRFIDPARRAAVNHEKSMNLITT